MKLKYKMFLLLVLLSLISWAKAESVLATFTWEIPIDRVDGTPLLPEEIGGFNIYQSESLEVINFELLTTVSVISNTYEHAFNFSVPGVYTRYFALTTFDIDGNESSFSNVVSKTFLVTSIETDLPNSPKLKDVDIKCVEGCSIHFNIQTTTE